MNAAANISTKQRLKRIFYFFPFRLLILHFKRNHFLLFFWVLLFGYTLNFFASRYGVAYQFLYPEYQGVNDFISFAILGFALGGFILAFNLYTYILHGFRFPFIVTLNRPFVKFSINNFIIPLVYVIVFIWVSVRFQREEELLTYSEITGNIAGFLTGMFIFLILSLLYFTLTNKNVLHYKPNAKKKRINQLFKRVPQSPEPEDEQEAPVATNLHKRTNWVEREKRSADWHVETYLVNIAKIGLARRSEHYNRQLLEKVFAQNHVNASLFEIALVISFILIGSLGDNPFFVIPAAASMILLFTMLLMLTSALFSWIKGWTLTVFIIVFATLNFFSSEIPLLNVEDHAYGLIYDGPKAPYSKEVIAEINSADSLAQADFLQTVDILDEWRLKNQEAGTNKPKLLIINTSGGGSRSALWTISALMMADSLSNGELMDHAALISGSSGGMIGAAYYRELVLRHKLGFLDTLFDQRYCENIGKDLLNPILFSMATNDLFIRYRKVQDGDQLYTKDRAWAFEKQLNANTGYILTKRLKDYYTPEKNAIIPMLVMAPTILNDGRRLIISSQPVSYLCQNKPVEKLNSAPIAEDVEFSRLFKEQGAENVWFTSALRMNATFPFVMPMVSLPSEPPIEVMDAGMRDNFGIKSTLQFLYTFRNWINTNTSGVVVLQIRDVNKEFDIKKPGNTLIQQFVAPLGSVYGNFTKMQDYNGDQMFRYLSAWFENDIDLVTFQMPNDDVNRVSLSWHLTNKEKMQIKSNLHTPEFQAELDKLLEILGEAR